MVWRSRLGTPTAFLLILYCLIGCARRSPSPAPTVVNVSPTVAIASPTPAVNAPPPNDVAILYHGAGAHADIAAQLRNLLPPETYRVTVADVQSSSSQKTLDTLRRNPKLFTVAIGLPAARFARDELRGPVLFAGVFNYQELLVSGRPVHGVAVMPPLDLQVRDWRKLDPRIRRVGLIVSQSHRELIAPAELAAKMATVSLRSEVSGSDRETLYLFKRMAPQIDGLWLLPDDQILSPAILRDLLEYAVSHGVRVCVFSDALLDWGALMSASPTPADTARILRRLLEKMAAGTSAIPALTPTSELVVHLNIEVAARLGLSSSRSSWIVRGTQ